ncbi:hypothetical protein HYPSUDRAFT_40406 [Hypholoma sublateritium FD-334 SS-4]|uniref:Cytoplasmic tRNA 2-thiolation protein 2 n=1 Tax=Hypholoma sublateritium (strain FD-334 SS-4) TaxID=945553 RepID=A0A0D2PT62_HYPSF|nr:hypothetical protein HYPSUDRAFT_40406 [Hypholoma sublateritium FD-334 SS-4]
MSACENPNVDQDALMTRRQKFDGKTKICVKCKENTGNIVIRYAVYCKSCFFPLIQTRFRKSLEPSINVIPDGSRRKGLKAAGSLVIAFSGGTSSTAMLDLVAKTYFAQRTGDTEERRGGKEHPRNLDRGVWKGKPVVCFVEVCGAFDDQRDRTDEIKAVVGSYPGTPFEFIPLRLEDAFNPLWWKQVTGDLSTSALSLGLDMRNEDLQLNQSTSEPSPLVALRRYLASLPTQTALYNAIHILTRVLLLHTAASRKASHLILGTSLTSLSVNLISGIAQGAGFSVAEEAKEEWKSQRGASVRVVRPLREVGMKECAIWDWWCGLHIVGRSRKFIQGGGRSAIGALTRDFIFGLESDFPATVSTVARTCAKLTPKEGSDGICVLCERPAQHGVQAWKSRISIRSYDQASSSITGNTRPPHLTETEIANLTLTSQDVSALTPSLTPRLCYACHTTLTSRSSRGTVHSGQSPGNIPIPTWVHAALQPTVGNEDSSDDDEDAEITQSTKLSQMEMKAQIVDFLLDEQ